MSNRVKYLMSFDGVSADLYERLNNKADFFRHALKYYAENSELCSSFFDDKDKVAIILEKNRNGEYGKRDKRSRSYKNAQENSANKIAEYNNKNDSDDSATKEHKKERGIFANGIQSGSSYD